jgi:hypothetical protein
LSIAAQSKQQTPIKQVVSIFLFNLSDYHLIRGALGTTAINYKKTSLNNNYKKKNSELSQNRCTTAINYKTYLDNPVYNLRPFLEDEIAVLRGGTVQFRVVVQKYLPSLSSQSLVALLVFLIFHSLKLEQ